MKSFVTFALLALALGATANAADVLSKTGPTHPMDVICFDGKIDSDHSCSLAAQGIKREIDGESELTMTCGESGHASFVSCTYVGSKDGTDYYRLIRRFPAGDRNASTSVKTVRFSGQRVIAFKDEYQVVVMDPVPEDHKAAVP